MFLRSIAETLSAAIPACALFSWIIFLFLLAQNRKNLSEFASKAGGAAYGWLAVIVLFSLALRLLVPPIQHVMYLDEPWYMEAAKHILQTGHSGDYPKSIGWPFLLSSFFFVFGTNNWVALYGMIVIGALSAAAVFFLTFAITNKKTTAIFAALLIGLQPIHIRWSATAETNVVSLFMVCLAVTACSLYFQKKTRAFFWLSLSAICLAAQFRPENYILFLLFPAGNWILGEKNNVTPPVSYVFAWLLFIALSLPNLAQVLHYYSSLNFSEVAEYTGIRGANWSLQNLFYNTRHYGISIFNGSMQPLLFSFLSLIGAILLLIKDRKIFSFLCLWLGFWWAAYFSSWIKTLGGEDALLGKGRIVLSFYPVLGIFAASALSEGLVFFTQKIKRPSAQTAMRILIVGLLISSCLPYVDPVSKMFGGDGHRLETRVPELAEKDIPSGCLIIANHPTILRSTTELNVVDLSFFLENHAERGNILRSTDCVLFFDDLICQMSAAEGELCGIMKSSYRMEEYRSYDQGKARYTFYKILP
jgi:hypothetical protein